MESKDQWFFEQSAYQRHPIRPEPLSDCCTEHLKGTSLTCEMENDLGETGCYPLYQCAACKKYYAKTDRGYVRIDSIYKYKIKEAP